MQERTNLSKYRTHWIVSLAPVIFVLLWATGFVGAKYGMREAEPFTFLAYRFWITALIFSPVVVWLMRGQPFSGREVIHSLVSGCLIHGAYLGGVFYAIDRGLAAGLSSLIVSFQPFITVFFAAFLLGENIKPLRLVCFAVAILGVLLVLLPKQNGLSNTGINQETLFAAVISTIAISFGSVYQKRFVGNLNLFVGTGFQFVGAAIMLTLLSVLFEAGEIVWTRDVVFAMAWLVIVLSIGAVCLLMFLIRVGSSVSVASLFFLVPVVAMLMTWVLFGEALDALQMVGSAIVVISVGLASRIKA